MSRQIDYEFEIKIEFVSSSLMEDSDDLANAGFLSGLNLLPAQEGANYHHC